MNTRTPSTALVTTGHPTLDTMEFTLAGRPVSFAEIAREVGKLPKDLFGSAVAHMIAQGHAEELRMFLHALEIQQTKSAFNAENLANVDILEETMATYPFSRWLDEMGIEYTKATRDNLCKWWESYMSMAAENGYVVFGQIAETGRVLNLWKATGELADKMEADPPGYRFYRALVVNDATQMQRALSEIGESWRFLEILTGETEERMRTSEKFLGGFSLALDNEKHIERTIAAASWSVQLVLQRG